MYQVLIVDDEKDIRDGLSAWIKENMPLEVVGCCSHGLEALQFIAGHPVDIVMTDIRMPFMNGLELMEILKRQYPFTNVIILSGYSDFDYAKKAIQEGVIDYLLKPVHFPDLSNSLAQVIQRLDEAKQAQHRIEVLQLKERQLTRVLREQFLNKLIHESLNAEEVEQLGAEGEVLLEGDSFTAAVVRLDRMIMNKLPIAEKELRLILFALDNIFDDLWDSRMLGYHWVDKSAAEVYVIAKSQAGYAQFPLILEHLVKYTGLFKSTFSLSIGPTVKQPSLLHRSAYYAKHALSEQKKPSAMLVFDAEITEGMLTGEAKRARNEEKMPEQSAEQDNVILVQAKKFMTENYHRSITLKDVAEQVYISPGHLSALFKETGETFLKYLTSLRIEKAEKLLLESNCKVYEVVELVGYADPAYFSEVFKKYTGKSPNEYRGKQKHVRGGN